MSPQHITLAVVVASCASALAMFYWCEFGKGGQRDLGNWLDAEIEQGIELLRQIESHSCAKLTINGQEVANIATINFNVSSNGARNGASGNPGQVDTRLASPFEWVCDKRGHKFAHEVCPRRCVFCGVSE